MKDYEQIMQCRQNSEDECKMVKKPKLFINVGQIMKEDGSRSSVGCCVMMMSRKDEEQESYSLETYIISFSTCIRNFD
jgi:hypothetical protein